MPNLIFSPLEKETPKMLVIYLVSKEAMKTTVMQMIRNWVTDEDMMEYTAKCLESDDPLTKETK